MMVTRSSSFSAAAGGRAQPPEITPKSLERAALHYLERYSCSTASLRRVLLRRVERSVQNHGTDRVTAESWVASVIERMSELGYLDDDRHAAAKVQTFRRQGRSTRAIRAALMTQGVAAETVVQAMTEQEPDEADSELEAAAILARRRRLGPHRPEAERAERRMKDLAVLARAGFSLAVARQVIDATDLDDRSNSR